MIKTLVDAFSAGVQILVVAILAVGAAFGYFLIPDSLPIGPEGLSVHPLAKVMVGGVIAWITEVIVLGPAFVLLDIRNTVQAIDKRAATLAQENKGKQSEEPKTREVPDTIFFGYEILFTPTMEEAGIPRRLGMLGVFESNLEVGDWVNRGDLLLRVTFHFYHGTEKPRRWFIPDPTYEEDVTLHSPVSGLVIGFRDQYIAYHGMAMATSSGQSIAYGDKPVFPMILLPRDEPPQRHYTLSFYEQVKRRLGEWPRILVSHREKGYIRGAELGEELALSKIEAVKLERFEVKEVPPGDAEILNNVQNLRERNLVLRDKLLHLVKDGDSQL